MREALQSFVDASGLPFATMFMDKSVLEEQHPAYIGMYDGRLMDESVRSFVESCDRVLIVGAIMSDFNTGAFTARLDPKKTIDIRHHRTQVGSKVYPNVEMKDILAELTRRVTKRSEKCKNPDSAYNDLASWHYSELPRALGCDGWFTARVATCGEFDQALKTAEQVNTGAYIEVVTDKYAASPLSMKLRESIQTLYQS